MAVAESDTSPLLEVRGLQMHFPVTEGIVISRKVGEVKAVDGIDFTVRRGETLGLVGESGCGKTTTGRCILRLEKPTAGEIIYDGVDIAKMRAQGPLVAAPADSGHLSGSVQFAEPAHEGRRDHRRADHGSRHRARCSTAHRTGARAAVGLRSRSEICRPLPARDVGRAAPARRHRPRPCARTRVHRLRRGGLGARRVDPGAGDQSARGSAQPLWPDLPVHRPRPFGRRGICANVSR